MAKPKPTASLVSSRMSSNQFMINLLPNQIHKNKNC